MATPENTRMFYCKCGCSALAVSYDEFDPEILISPWAHVFFDGHSWRAKWRFIRQILKWGHPYRDFVIHTPDQARKLGNYLNELAEQLEEVPE